MASSVSNTVFTNPWISRLIFSNLTLRELDQVKGVRRSCNANATEVQKQRLPGLFPEEFAQIVKDATFQNFHRAVRIAGEAILSVGYEPAEVDQLSSPIVAGYVDGVAFLACRVAESVNGKLERRLVMGMYPELATYWGVAPRNFGIHLFGGQIEDLLTLLKTGRVVSYFSVLKAPPRCCVRLCDWVARKICKKEIERPRFEYPVFRIENFKLGSVVKEKQA